MPKVNLSQLGEYMFNQARVQQRQTGYGRLTQRVMRNDPCPCGSGIKFKRCCSGNGHKWRP